MFQNRPGTYGMAKSLEIISSTQRDVDRDLTLAQSIARGSIQSWHDFLHRYSGLIHGVVQRHLFTSDEDAVGTVYVDVLKALYEEDISSFRGDATLAAWLIIYTRNRVFDHIRKQRGRRRDPAGLERLSSFDRDVYRYYFVDRLPLDVVVHILNWRRDKVIATQIIESIERIETNISRRYLRRLENDRIADMYGLDSGQMLKFMVNLRCEYEEKVKRNRPDARMLDEEAKQTSRKLKELLSQLTSEEQKVIQLRFAGEMSAPEIAEQMGYDGQRRSYTVINRVLRKLRRGLGLNSAG